MAATQVPWVGDGEAGSAAITKRPVKFLLTQSGMDVDNTGFTGLMPVFNVVSYILPGDTDATAGINRAFAAVKLAGGGTVYFPTGQTFTVSGMVGCAVLTIANRIDNCRVWAYGATIVNTTTGITLGLLGSDVAVLGGRWTRTGVIDYDVSSAGTNVHTIFVGSDQVSTQASRVVVRDTDVQYSSLHGISASACDGIRIINNTVRDCLGTGIFGGNCAGRIVVEGNTVERTRDDNIHLDNLVGATAVMDGQVISGNHTRHTYATNIRASGVGRCAIIGNTTDNSRASAISCLLGGQVDTITGATNATPIVITTSAAHGRAVGDMVAIKEVLGNLAANGVWILSAVTANTYTLYNSVGSGAYVSGGRASAQVGLTIANNTISRAGRNFGVGKKAGTGVDTTVNVSDCGAIYAIDGSMATITIHDNAVNVCEGVGIAIATCIGLSIRGNVLNMGQGPNSGAAYTGGIQLGKAVDATGRGVQDFVVAENVIVGPSGGGVECFNVFGGSIQGNKVRGWKAAGGAGVKRGIEVTGTNVFVDNNVLEDTKATGTYLSLTGTNVVDGLNNKAW